MLERRFGDSDKQLKALTSAGTELETIAFRDEELSADKVISFYCRFLYKTIIIWLQPRRFSVFGQIQPSMF